MTGKPLKIACIGGGPAGLYFALLMKLQNPAHDITVYERNKADDTFGWGVVFSDQTLQNFAGADTKSRDRFLDSLNHWDDIEVHFKGDVLRSGGHGFCGIERKHLLTILQERCAELGVNMEFEANIDVEEGLPEADLIIAADGINSAIRAKFADDFKPDIEVRPNKFVWLGTKRMLDAFTFLFKETEWGWFQVHAYRFNEDTSTYIVETTEETWKAAGIDEMSQEEGIRFCEELFADNLQGHELISNASHLRGSAIWMNFPRILNDNWVKDNIVLMGDSAHTAHYSIGSGTKLAMEDAIELSNRFAEMPDAPIAEILDAYQETRKVEVLKLQSAARNSMEWFENIDRYAHMEPEQFNYSLLTRSQRVSHENLRLRDSGYLDGVERWFVSQAAGTPANDPVPPMFVPFKLHGMELKNRVVVSPMAMYSAKDGVAGDFHLVHLGSRASGGAGLVFTEMTCVAPDARISPGCAGLWNDKHQVAWKRIVDYVHENSTARIALQLGHAGPKGSTKLGWEGGDEPLDEGNWPLIAPSAVKWDETNQMPREMDRADMDRVTSEFVDAVRRGAEAGFDMLELHAAHGYLLSAFISPLTNKRTDDYGGSLENRLRYPLEVFDAMRAAWPEDKPMSVRISASDWHPDGVDADEAIEIARAFSEHGADLIDVSAGQTSVEAEPVYGRMFQTPFSDRIRNEAKIRTMAVGNIYETDHANSIIAAGRADLVALARSHLADPYWTLHAAAELGYTGADWTPQYWSGRDQLVRNRERAAEMATLV